MAVPIRAPPMGVSIVVGTQSLIYSDVPVQCTCPICHPAIVTRVKRRADLIPWLLCGGLILVRCWLGRCLFPFCIDSLHVRKSAGNANKQNKYSFEFSSCIGY